MRDFVKFYLFYVVVFFVLFYLPTSSLSVWINQLQREFTLYLMSFFLESKQVDGFDIWINPSYKIVITQACNGLIPIFLLWASILAYPSSLKKKAFWMLFGYVVFTVVNTARILFVVYATTKGGSEVFHFYHDIVGNTVLMIVGLLLFITYVKSPKKHS